jgi:hypothetical protein
MSASLILAADTRNLQIDGKSTDRIYSKIRTLYENMEKRNL